MPIVRQLFALLIVAAFLQSTALLCAQDEGAGAFIIVSLEGDVKVKDPAGDPVPAAEIAAGKTLFEGQTVVTGDNGKIMLLLSNGSVTTLKAKSELLLDKFKQAKFELPADTMVSDLENEPSKSETKLKLGYGDLIFNVKKLNKGSTFDISSPLGSAGIRGTDGQLVVTVDPNTGNFSGGVNMLSGAVAFTSPAGAVLNVPAGQAVQAQASPTGQQIGQVQEAPVPAQVTQEITQTTTEATETTAEVRVAEVVEAVQEVEQKIEEAPPRKEPEEKPEEKPEETPEETPEDTPEDTPAETPEDAPAEKPEDAPAETPEDAPAETPAEKPGDAPSDAPAEKPADKPRPPRAQAREASGGESQEQLLEVDDQASLAQQGVVEKDPNAARKLKSLGLEKDDFAQLRKVSDSERNELLADGDLTKVKEKVHERVEKGKFIDELTAKDPDAAKKLDLNKLSRDEVKHLSNLDNSDRKQLLKEDNHGKLLEIIQDGVDQKKITDLGLDQSDTSLLNSYSKALRKRLQNEVDSSVMQALLKLRMKEGELSIVMDDLGQSNIQEMIPVTTTPDMNPDEETNGVVGKLLDLTGDNGNPEIVGILLELGGGSLNDKLLELGREANFLLTDTEVTGGLDPDRIFSFAELKENPFYSETTALAENFFSNSNGKWNSTNGDAPLDPITDLPLVDIDDTGNIVRTEENEGEHLETGFDMDEELFAYVSKSSHLSGPIDLSEYYNHHHKQYLAISAAKHLDLNGTIEIFQGNVKHETYLSFLSAGVLNSARGTRVIFLGDHLHMGSWKSMEVIEVSMESGQSISIQTMEDLFLQDTNLRVRSGDEIHMSAFRDLQLNGVKFDKIREIYMQATTIDLMNINFPGGSMVNMETLYGGIDGKYPTFPTGDPKRLMGNRQVGRVNFIQNVRYNQKLMKNRADFDRHGQNINIQARP